MNIILNKLQLDKEEFKFQFQSHPEYPSALAFSDTLNFMGVRNAPYSLEKEYWKDLPNEFLTIYKNNFSLVQKQSNSIKIFSDKEESISEQDLLKHSSDVVIIFQKEEAEHNNSKINYTAIVLFILSIFIIYSFIFLSWGYALYNLLSIVGLYLSSEIYKEKFGKQSPVLSGICGKPSSSQNTKEESCSKIIKSDKINILGLKLSDFSLIYFIGLSVLGLLLPQTDFILKSLSFISIIVILYSLSIQIFIEKTFCKICLSIISILVSQIIVSSFFFKKEITIDFGLILSSIIILLIISAVIIYLNENLSEKEELKKSNIKNLRFKRDFDLFNKEYSISKEFHFTQKSPFFLGSKDAKVHIDIVSNPFCGYCKGAHEIMEKLLKSYPDDISFSVRFNYFESDKTDEDLTLLLKVLKYHYNNSELEFSEKLKHWFTNRDIKEIKEKYASLDLSNITLDDILSVGQENKHNDLNFTPILLINGKQYPEKYEREDIFYFIDELIDTLNEDI